mmetsp:Transcript_4385/g.8296  ORF Transcript_4385/g.8296 Transcript_4385/m.8296 type:complete len:296 (+) Transcript_4385:88-975(+)
MKYHLSHGRTQLKRLPRNVLGARRGFAAYSKTSPGGLIMVAAREAVRAIRDPYLRGDSVAAVGEATGQAALERMLARMKRESEGRQVLEDQPTLEKEDDLAAKLRLLPAHTFGGAFARYLDMHGFEFGKRPPVELIADPQLAYVMQRYRETHDLLHTLTGVPVSVTGETALKWFEMSQTGLPMTALAAFFGGVRAETSERDTLPGLVNYCARAGRDSKFFMGVYFERHWETPLVDLRKMLQLPKMPKNLPSLDASWDPSREKVLRGHYEGVIQSLGQNGDEQRKAPFLTYLKQLQ